MVTIACAVTLLLSTIYALELHDAELFDKLWNIKALLSNFLLLFSGWPRLSMLGYNNPTWYLCILIQCYAVFYGIQWLCERTAGRPVLWYGAFICLTIAAIHWWRLPSSNFRGYECFFMGAMMEEAFFLLGKRREAGRKDGVFIVIGVLLYYSAAFLLFRNVISLTQRRAMVFLIYPPLIAAAWLFRDQFYSKTARLFGKISFEAYLWHFPALRVFQILIAAMQWNVTHSYFSMVVFAVIVYILAYFLYVKVEQPINRRLRELGGKME